MILEQETHKKFGYYSIQLKPKSNKKILVQCDECGIIREIQFNQYRDLCQSCAMKQRIGSHIKSKGSYPIEEGMLEEETYEKFGYYPNQLKVKSHEKILARCNMCNKIRELSKSDYRNLCYNCAIKKRDYIPKNTYSVEKGILEKETFEKYGYYPSQLKGQSSKKVLVKCEDCGKIREISNFNYHELCLSCSLKGEKSWKWQGGVSFEPYCIKFNEEFRERVRNYFGSCCYVCGKNETDNKAKLSVHHVNYNKMVCCNDVKPLFVPLCKSCHSKTNTNRKYWEEFFTISLEYLTKGECYAPKGRGD